MSRKTVLSRPATSSTARKTGEIKSQTKGESAASAARKADRAAAARHATAAPIPRLAKAVKKPPAQRPSRPAETDVVSGQILARAEADITRVIDSLNNQMNVALTTLTELATARSERGKAVVRTAPLDRATATFQRLVAEVVEDQLAEALPPLVALRNEMAPRGRAPAAAGPPDSAFLQRATETIDHVLALVGVQTYEARTGEAFDPLIHLAVGETSRPDLADAAVAEALQPGFRSAHGKVVVPARVRVNRR